MITIDSAANCTPTLEETDAAVVAMEQAIKQTLRNVDVSTRFSHQQFLVILVNTEHASLQMIINRIFGQFYKLYPHKNMVANYDIADLNGSSGDVSFS